MNISDKVLVETHILSSAAKIIVWKFSPKYERPYEDVEVIGHNVRNQDKLIYAYSERMNL